MAQCASSVRLAKHCCVVVGPFLIRAACLFEGCADAVQQCLASLTGEVQCVLSRKGSSLVCRPGLRAPRGHSDLLACTSVSMLLCQSIVSSVVSHHLPPPSRASGTPPRAAAAHTHMHTQHVHTQTAPQHVRSGMQRAHACMHAHSSEYAHTDTLTCLLKQGVLCRSANGSSCFACVHI
jgi:hypothetical protein